MNADTRADSSRSRIGIIAGSGPEAGIDLWSKVLEENRRAHGDTFQGDIDAPNVTVLSVSELGHSMDLPHTNELVWRHLKTACEQISELVDVFAIACNTLYAFHDDIMALNLSATVVSPVDALRTEADRRGLAGLSLLAAGPVADFDGGVSPYARLTDDLNIELPEDRQRLHGLIENIKRHGGSSPELEAEFEEITRQLNSPVAALACTELPLLAADGIGVELIDVTRLLARELLNLDGTA